MKRWIGSRAAVLCLASVCVAALPASSALASKTSIKDALKSYSSRVSSSELAVANAIETYKTTHQPAPVDTALENAIKVLAGLKTKIAAQSAAQPAVKTAKTKLLKGLSAVIVAYQHLGTAFQEHGTDPQAAESEVQASLEKVKAGNKQLKEAAKLLR